MIVRADFGRGLAHQTETFYRHIQPDVTVCIDMSLVTQKWPQDFTAYPDAILTEWKGYTAPFENRAALDKLAQCDVVYSAETYYDERLPEMVDTVLHVNPEFFRGQKATQYWYPSTWRREFLPPGVIVPTPIDDERIATEPPDSAKLLHVSGHRAAGDRNGSRIVEGLTKTITREWRLTTQDGLRISPQVMRYVEVKGRTKDRWELYDGCGILVYPRRYGGQSLQVNEAMARGLAVVMGDHSPNQDWPIRAVPSKPSGFVQTPAGKFRMHLVQTSEVKEAINEMVENSEVRRQYQKQSLEWARANSWSAQIDRIRGLLR